MTFRDQNIFTDTTTYLLTFNRKAGCQRSIYQKQSILQTLQYMSLANNVRLDARTLIDENENESKTKIKNVEKQCGH